MNEPEIRAYLATVYGYVDEHEVTRMVATEIELTEDEDDQIKVEDIKTI